MLALIQKAQKAVPELSMDRQENTAHLLLALLRGKLDLAIVDLPLKERGISVHPFHSEPLIAVLRQGHFLSARPMVRLFELKKEQVALVSGRTDPAAVVIDAMLQQAGIAFSQTVSSVIELLDHVAVHRSVGLMRASAGRLRRDGVVFKPLANSMQLETAIVWRTDDRNPAMVSFRDALIAFGQQKSTS
jgi:DNA-binding transcriptional LysR family regulator